MAGLPSDKIADCRWWSGQVGRTGRRTCGREAGRPGDRAGGQSGGRDLNSGVGPCAVIDGPGPCAVIDGPELLIRKVCANTRWIAGREC